MKKILIISSFIFLIQDIWGQNERKIYFSNSLFCMVEISHSDTLEYMVKDGYISDSIVSWSFGTIIQLGDTLTLNCFIIYNHKEKKYEFNQSLWTHKICQDELIKYTQKANSQEEIDILPELITRFTVNFYRFINVKYHSSITVYENDEVVKAFYDFDQFIEHFPNDSIKFIKTFINQFNKPKELLFDKAVKNYEIDNYAKALLYATAFRLIYYEFYKKERDVVNDDYILDLIDELSNVALLGDGGNEYAYFNEYNYVLLDKFQHAKELYPKTKRFADVWW